MGTKLRTHEKNLQEHGVEFRFPITIILLILVIGDLTGSSYLWGVPDPTNIFETIQSVSRYWGINQALWSEEANY